MQIGSFFDIKPDAAWKEYIKIDAAAIGKIFKYSSVEKAVYLYKYGCITFVNFTQDEIIVFLEYLKNTFVDLDYRLFSRLNETYVISSEEEEDMGISDHPEMDDIIGAVLARSTELHKIETELSDVLDSGDILIRYLNSGYLRANNKKVTAVIAKSIRLKYRSIESIRLLERPAGFNKTIEIRQMFDHISDYFELNDRYRVLLNQMDTLDSITGAYFSFRGKLSERRLLLFEIFLLSLFPLMHIISH